MTTETVPHAGSNNCSTETPNRVRWAGKKDQLGELDSRIPLPTLTRETLLNWIQEVMASILTTKMATMNMKFQNFDAPKSTKIRYCNAPKNEIDIHDDEGASPLRGVQIRIALAGARNQATFRAPMWLQPPPSFSKLSLPTLCVGHDNMQQWGRWRKTYCGAKTVRNYFAKIACCESERGEAHRHVARRSCRVAAWSRKGGA